jgi:HK97 family phage prohead protease
MPTNFPTKASNEERHLMAIEDAGDHYVLKFHKSEEESPFEVTDQDNPLTDEPATTPSAPPPTGGEGKPPQPATQGGREHEPYHEDEEEEEGRNTKPQTMDQSIERRFVGATTLELRETGQEGRRAEGYAAVFDSPTTIQTHRGAFREVLTRSAFEGRLEDNTLALFNHDQASPLAKVGAGLELSLDDHGLRYSFPIPNTTTGRDLVELMERGIVKDASFAFTVGEDGQRWERDEDADMDVRTITKLNRLVDVSVVTVGAYPDASSALRSFEGSNFNELNPEGVTPQPVQDNAPEGPQNAPEQTLSLGGLRSAIIRAKRSTF